MNGTRAMNGGKGGKGVMGNSRRADIPVRSNVRTRQDSGTNRTAPQLRASGQAHVAADRNVRAPGWFLSLLLGAVVTVGAFQLGAAPLPQMPQTARMAGRTNLPPFGFRAMTNARMAPFSGPRTNTGVMPSRFPAKPNMAGLPAQPPARTNAIPAPTKAAGAAKSIGTNAAAVKTKAGKGAASPPAQPAPGLQGKAANIWKQISDRWSQFRASSTFMPAVGIAGAALLSLLWWQVARSKTRPKTAVTTPALAGRPSLKGAKRVHSCNVLEAGGETRRLWRFDAHSDGFVLSHEQALLEGQTLPSGLVGKDWRSLFQQKLNIAWLPPEQVFVRVAQLPKSDFNETVSMVELQLEKLSPMPVTQIVWSIQVLPHTKDNLQTVIVMIVGRNVLEEFLGKLEGQGYIPDRLELPSLDQLQATVVREDGAWVYPEAAGGKNSALVAWWYGGVLQNVALVLLPAKGSAGLGEDLMQMAWAGELEGWLTSPPRWHLVAQDQAAAEWEPALREALEQPVEVSAPLAKAELAGLTARRAAHAEPLANLLPAEFATRYRQQFVDRLWMRGVGGVIGLYIVGVLIYWVALQVALFRTRGIENQVANLGQTYTNALQVRARYQILKDMDDLKYAGLDCWKAVADLIPAGVTLDTAVFSDGRKLTLGGTAGNDHGQELLDFDTALRRYSAPTQPGQPLFAADKGDPVTYTTMGANQVRWGLSLELRRAEVQ
jgi:hypothetical protein